MRALSEPAAALRAVFASPPLRRLELAWTGSIAGEFAYSVALSVYAYRQGGAAAVGLVWLLRMIPAAAGAPFAALLGDRTRRERVMLAANVARAAATAATALAVLAGGPAAAVYALSVVVALLSTIFWPAQGALLRTLSRTPGELTAANTASSVLENVGSFLGPALCGLLLALTSMEVAFAVTAVVFAWSALVLRGISTETPARGRDGTRVAAELGGGLRAVAADRTLRALVGVYGVWALATGALNVLVVLAAIELLGMGEAGVGALNAAIGIGGLVGAVAVLAVVSERRLALVLALGAVTWSAPIALLGAWPVPAAAIALLAAVGVGNILVDVAGLTLLQRAADDTVLMRVLGIVEGLWVGGVGLGAAAVPLLIALIGARGALVAVGLVLPAAAILAARPLGGAAGGTADDARVELLRAVPFLAPLPPPALERLARRAVPVAAPHGRRVVEQGAPGDRFYVVVEGELRVTVDGEARPPLGPGDWFGEIALLRDVPRTATVEAAAEARLLALERDDFLQAVTGSAPSAEAAEGVVRARLGAIAPAHRLA